MRTSCSVALISAAILASTLPIVAKDKHNWITGSVVNISATERPSAAAAYVYTIHAGNREFAIRLEAVRPANASAGEHGLVGPSINVGESITFAPEGTRAWILSEGTEYQCRVLRQTLLQIPPSTGIPETSPREPKSRPEDGKTAGESSASVNSGEQRPTTEFPPPPVIKPTSVPAVPAPCTFLADGSVNSAPCTFQPGGGINPAQSTFQPGGGINSAQSTFRVGGGATAPALIYKVEPEYSEVARRAGLEGTLVLYAEVGTDGYASNFRVVRGLGLGLDEKAIEAVRKWKFRPGSKDGKPVVVAATIEVNFRLLRDPASPNPLAPRNGAANPLMLQGSASYLQQRLHFWELKDAKAELGRVVGQSRNLGSEIFTFADPTKRYRVFDLTFDTQTKKLVEIRVHPWGGLRWDECKALWGSDYSQSITEEPGVLLYSYLTRPITALVRSSGEVVSFDFH